MIIYCLIPAALADGCSGTVLSPVEVLQSLVAHRWTIDFQQQVMGWGWAGGGPGWAGGWPRVDRGWAVE